MPEIDDETMMRPGDVVIDEITLRSYTGFNLSLKGIFQNFMIYEDIFSNCMSGSITLIDSMNLIKHFPIIGAETLTVKYKTPYKGSPLVKLVFRTYKISVKVATAQPSTQMVRIEFMSDHAFKSMQKKVSKSFSRMPVSEMAQNIFLEYLARTDEENSGILSAAIQGAVAGGMIGGVGGPILGVAAAVAGAAVGAIKEANDDDRIPLRTLEDTYDTRSYVIPYWSPLYTINWLAHRARSKYDTSLCDYVFYENSDGHHFVPISRLKQQSPKFTYTDYVQGFRSVMGERMIESELRNIIAMTVEDISDRVKQQSLGMLSSAILAHDMVTKTWKTVHFNYDESFYRQGLHVEQYPLLPAEKTDYTKAVESSLKYYPNTTHTVNGIVSNSEPEETVLLRQSLLNQIHSMNLIVECHGDTNVKVGQVIELRIPAPESTKKADKYEDDYMRGRYLVTTMKHTVTDREHTMVMTLSRDSLPEPIADFKKPELGVEN